MKTRSKKVLPGEALEIEREIAEQRARAARAVRVEVNPGRCLM